MKNLSDLYLNFLCAELADVLGAGVSVPDGFRLIAEKETDAATRLKLERVYAQTDAGCGVAGAMRDAGGFPDYCVKMVELGESAGSLDVIFARLAAYYGELARIRRSIRSAVTYPLVLLVVMLAVFYIFLTELLPVFDRVFAQLGATMTGAALAFLNFGQALYSARYVLLAVVCALALAVALISLIPRWRSGCADLCERLFSAGRTGRKISAARFAAAMSLAYAGTGDLRGALQTASGFCVSRSMRERSERCIDAVENGSAVADALMSEKMFNALCCRIIAIGSRAGTVDSALADVAKRSGAEMDEAISRAAGRAEPVIVALLCVCTGLLLAAVMLPLIGIMSVV